MMFQNLAKSVQAFAVDNASTILTGVGVVGTVSTAVLTGRASFKAARIIHQEALQRNPGDAESVGNDFAGLPDLARKEKAVLVWQEFIPPIGVGSATVACIIYANRRSAAQAAAMAAAYSMSEKTFSDYKEKVQGRLGIKKETDLRDEIAKERIDANPPGTLIVVGEGDVLCYDVLTGRYFKSSVEKLKKGENEVNADIVTGDGASLSRFYDEIGLPQTPYSDTVGWNLDNRCELQLSTIMTADDRPCISVDFAGWPKPDYIKVWG